MPVPGLPSAGSPSRPLKPKGFRAETLSRMLRSALPAVLVLVPLCSGCVAVAAAGVVGVGIVQYQRNEVEQDFPNDLYEAWQAAFEALGRLGIEPTESELGPSEGRMEQDGLVVFVERHPEGFTRVRVRAGAFRTRDNLRRAQVVLQEIGASLERQDELRAWADKVKGVQAQPKPDEPGAGNKPTPVPRPKRSP